MAGISFYFLNSVHLDGKGGEKKKITGNSSEKRGCCWSAPACAATDASSCSHLQCSTAGSAQARLAEGAARTPSCQPGPRWGWEARSPCSRHRRGAWPGSRRRRCKSVCIPPSLSSFLLRCWARSLPAPPLCGVVEGPICVREAFV